MHGEYKMPGGKLIVADLESRDGKLVNVRISGDFFLEPDSALPRINNTLEQLSIDTDTAALARAIDTALSADVMMYGISSEAIAIAVQRALATGDGA
ncbi:MAG: biotin--protein ligase [Rhodanobacter sp.]